MATDFRELIEPYHRELLVHCYRMLGNLQDAEDVLQETLLAAWRGLDGFEERSSIRTWLYRIATNRCLNALRSAARRPAATWNVPPRQVAVLILRDVLGFPAGQVADMLDATVDAVTSALHRARATLRRTTRPLTAAPVDAATVGRFVRAYQAADLPALVSLLTDDVFIAMPPIPYEYQGRAAVAGFCAALFDSGRRFELHPTGANGQPAFVTRLRSPTGETRAVGLLVLTLRGNRISGLTRFDETILPRLAGPGRAEP